MSLPKNVGSLIKDQEDVTRMKNTHNSTEQALQSLDYRRQNQKKNEDQTLQKSC